MPVHALEFVEPLDLVVLPIEDISDSHIGLFDHCFERSVRHAVTTWLQRDGTGQYRSREGAGDAEGNRFDHGVATGEGRDRQSGSSAAILGKVGVIVR